MKNLIVPYERPVFPGDLDTSPISVRLVWERLFHPYRYQEEKLHIFHPVWGNDPDGSSRNVLCQDFTESVWSSNGPILTRLGNIPTVSDASSAEIK